MCQSVSVYASAVRTPEVSTLSRPKSPYYPKQRKLRHSSPLSLATKPNTTSSEEDEAAGAEASGSLSEMLSSLSAWLVNPRRNPLARLHMNAVSARLRKYGLRYDDLYDPYDLDIKEALARLPREVVDARNQRLKRAMDLSLKHKYLPDDVQALQTPFRGYLADMLALVKKERSEREALGALPLYQRTIP